MAKSNAKNFGSVGGLVMDTSYAITLAQFKRTQNGAWFDVKYSNRAQLMQILSGLFAENKPCKLNFTKQNASGGTDVISRGFNLEGVPKDTPSIEEQLFNLPVNPAATYSVSPMDATGYSASAIEVSGKQLRELLQNLANEGFAKFNVGNLTDGSSRYVPLRLPKVENFAEITIDGIDIRMQEVNNSRGVSCRLSADCNVVDLPAIVYNFKPKIRGIEWFANSNINASNAEKGDSMRSISIVGNWTVKEIVDSLSGKVAQFAIAQPVESETVKPVQPVESETVEFLSMGVDPVDAKQLLLNQIAELQKQFLALQSQE